MPVYLNDGAYTRVKYLRYADDWVVGINGPRELAVLARTEAQRFLATELKLTLSVEKTHIRHAKTESALFLGTDIRVGSENPRIRKVRHPLGFTYPKRVAGWTSIMKAPMDRIVRRLRDRGFCDEQGSPKSVGRWTVLDDDQIIGQFNAVLRGYLGYYSFVDNAGAMNRVSFILRHSAAKTLAHRHGTKMTTIFRKHGRSLRVASKGMDGKEHATEFAAPRRHRRTPTNFRPKEAPNSPDGIVRTHVRLRTRSKLGKWCVICGETDGVQMHHLRHIRKIGEGVRGFGRIMATLNRKQIPVCKRHHEAIHRGELDGASLSQMYDLALAKA